MKRVSGVKRYGLFVLLVMAAWQSKAKCGQGVPVRLDGVVITLHGKNYEYKSTIPGAEVFLEGSDLRKLDITDREGNFHFEVPAGVYNLTVRMPGFYELTIKDVTLRKQPSGNLVAVLQPQLSVEPDLPVVGPREIAAPSLAVSFALEKPMRKGNPMKDRVILENVGRESILVPISSLVTLTQGSEQRLMMHLSVWPAKNLIASGRYDAAFESWYACQPGKETCRKLNRSESISYPVTLFSRKTYARTGQRQSYLYDRSTEYRGTVSIYFRLPQQDKAKRPTETGSVRSEFKILVRPVP